MPHILISRFWDIDEFWVHFNKIDNFWHHTGGKFLFQRDQKFRNKLCHVASSLLIEFYFNQSTSFVSFYVLHTTLIYCLSFQILHAYLFSTAWKIQRKKLKRQPDLSLVILNQIIVMPASAKSSFNPKIQFLLFSSQIKSCSWSDLSEKIWSCKSFCCNLLWSFSRLSYFVTGINYKLLVTIKNM